jgi:serine phosphatase RsbU (regulator of sigma subunit)
VSTAEPEELLRELKLHLGSERSGLREILDSLAEAVTIRDPHHHIIYANRAAVHSMGFASLEEMQRRPPHSIFADYIVEDERGRRLTMDDIPSVRLLAGEAPEPLVMRTTDRSTGAVRWLVLKTTPLCDQAGVPFAAVTVIEDTTRERIAELRDRFLSTATATLMASLDYQETLRQVARLAVPEIADWCAVDLIDEGGERQQVVVAHRDPAKLALATELRRYQPERPDADSALGRVLRTGVSELHSDVPDELIERAAADEEHLRLLRSVGLRSVLLCPLRARGRTFGVMTFVTAESLRRFDEDDRDFAEQIATRAAMAVDNARLATERQQIANTLQRSLLPNVVPSIEGWEIATMYRPSGTAEVTEVGGDFYDFYSTPAGWVVLLGDVTGKGVEAAAMTALVRHGARLLSKQEPSLGRIFERLDEALREHGGLSLCTAICVRLQGDHVVIASAGHPAPLIVRDDGRIREIGASGPLLGAWSGETWIDRKVPIAPDETLIIYTDGVTDAQGEIERFGTERFGRLLVDHAGESPSELLDALAAAFERFQVGGSADDTAVLALRPVGNLRAVGANRSPPDHLPLNVKAT